METFIDEKNAEFLKDIKLLVATPCYGGMCTVGYLNSMLELVDITNKLDIKLDTLTIGNESLITRARNEIVTYFYDNDYDYLMFIDADIEFRAGDVLSLLLKDLDVVAGAYPMKTLNIKALANKNLTLEDIEKNLPVYVTNFKYTEQDGTTVVNAVNGALEARDAGTGFMLIKKQVIKDMVSSYPELIYFSDQHNYNMETQSIGISAEKRYALFDTYIDHTAGFARYLSEDYAFCRRWQAIGGKVYIDPMVTLNHLGTYIFKGQPLLKSESLVEPEETGAE